MVVPKVLIEMLTSVVAPDAYSRMIDFAADRTRRQALRRTVEDVVGTCPEAFEEWLDDTDTWSALRDATEASYQRLVDQLIEFDRRRERHQHLQVTPTEATQIVDVVVEQFLLTLPPSFAIAVHDYRSTAQIKGLQSTFTAVRTFDDQVELMPAAIRPALRDDLAVRPVMEKVVEALRVGDPAAVLDGWARVRPSWLVGCPVGVTHALALLADVYELTEFSSILFEEVAEGGLDAAASYATVALRAHATNPERAQALAEKARLVDEHNPVVVVLNAFMAEDWPRVLASVDRTTAASTSPITGMYATALQHTTTNDSDTVIEFLTEVVDRYRPESTTLMIMLAQMRLTRSQRQGATSRQMDAQAAFDLSLRARDLRRRWRGNSAEAVRLACHCALVANRSDLVVKVGSPAPEGEATAWEADDAEVLLLVAQTGQGSADAAAVERARRSASAFTRELIEAEHLVRSGASGPLVAEQFWAAWQAAESEGDQVTLWISAAHAGVEPLPGQEILDARPDDLPMLCTAAGHLARGRFADAIALLRPRRDLEQGRRMLAEAYVRSGAIDEAVHELRDMAVRFADPTHLVGAAEVLARASRLDEASAVADEALSLLGAHPGRALLHEIRIAASMRDGAWQRCEVLTRAAIADLGVSAKLRWSLVRALYMQRRQREAFAVMSETTLAIRNSEDAWIWIELSTRHNPSAATSSTTLELAERYSTDPIVRRAAVNSYFAMGDAQQALAPGEAERWQEQVRLRAERPDPTDTFVSVDVPAEPEDLIESLRPFLEQQAVMGAEMTRRVRDEGWPYGMLAFAAGRPYSSTLIHRAAGFLPMASADQGIVDLERSVAHSALKSGVVLIDLSAVVTAWFNRDLWARLCGEFARPHMIDLSRFDIAAGLDRLRLPSSGSLGWDIEAGRPVYHDADAASTERLLQHHEWVHGVAFTLACIPTPPRDSDPGAEEEDDAWSATVRCAKLDRVPLWADDLGLRNLARSEGVEAFGTDSLLAVLADFGKLSDIELDVALENLRNEWVVDLPFNPAWIDRQVATESGALGPALTVFTRPSTWAIRESIEVWQRAATSASSISQDNLASWVHAAAYGVARAFNAPTAITLIAATLATSAAIANFDPTSFARCALAVSHVTTEAGLADAVEPALQMLLDRMIGSDGPEAGSSALALLGSELVDEHREVLRRLLFS